jgi:flagellar basal-body rod modification protein FlgD
MDVTTLLNSTSSSSSSSSASSTSSSLTMGKNDFLKLFVTQLQNQNPLSPMDSANFTSQLAQFSSLEQLTNLNTSMSNLVDYQNSMQNVLAISLIGKTVQVAGNQAALSGTADINFNLPSATAKTTLSIFNSSGTCVRQVELGAESTGDVKYAWDGKNSQGVTLPNGQYTFSIAAADASGAAVTATTLMYGTVTGITFENSTTYLVLDNGQKVQFGSIRQIGS